MELTVLNTELSAQNSETAQPIIKETKIDLKKQLDSVSIPSVKIPTIQDLLAKTQQYAIQYEEELAKAKEEQEKQLPKLPELLRNDKVKAQKIIDSLVSSAKEIKSSLVTSITSVPLHPYQQLIHDCLGPNFKAPSIQEYSIPDDYNALTCLKEIKSITQDLGDLCSTQMAQITAEAFTPNFNGILSENLNHGFAYPSTTPEGKVQWVVDKEKMAEHMRFIEMVKNIPADYIMEHPIEVAKIILSEFVRIHKSNRLQEKDSDLKYELTENVCKNPLEEIKKLFGEYNRLHDSSEKDINFLFNLLNNYQQHPALKNQ